MLASTGVVGIPAAKGVASHAGGACTRGPLPGDAGTKHNNNDDDNTNNSNNNVNIKI